MRIAVKQNRLFYLAAYVIYIAYMVHTRSGFSLWSSGNCIERALKYLCLSALLIDFFLKIQNIKLTIKGLIFSLVICVIIAAAFIYGSNTNLIFVLLFSVLSIDVPFDNIIRTLQISLTVGLLIVFSSCLLGILQNNVYHHWSMGSVAYSLGFNYYSFPQSSITNILLIRLFRKGDKCKTIDLIITLIIAFIAYLIFTTRLYWYETLLIVFLYWLVHCLGILKLEGLIWKVISTFGYYIGCVITFIITVYYDSSNGVWENINQLLSGRLSQMHKALEYYGIGLTAQKVEMIGAVEASLYGSEYLYVDSGYMYSLIAYGILFTVLILTLYTLLFRYSHRTKNKSLYIWLFAMMLLNLSNNFMVSLVTNPLIILTVQVAYRGMLSRKKVNE